MSSEEGGVGTVSSSVLRTLSRRGADGAVLFLAGVRRPFGALTSFVGFVEVRLGRLFLVGRFPEARFLALVRPAEVTELACFFFGALRFAIDFCPFEP
jgi:hypothetical protein